MVGYLKDVFPNVLTIALLATITPMILNIYINYLNLDPQSDIINNL